MSQAFRATDLKGMMHAMYPDVENGRIDKASYEHPMTAVGIVLLSAAFLGTTAGRRLMAFTGYSGQFVSAIAFNMLNNRLWIDGRYEHSSWWLKNGTIGAEQLWEHIEMACGMLFAGCCGCQKLTLPFLAIPLTFIGMSEADSCTD